LEKFEEKVQNQKNFKSLKKQKKKFKNSKLILQLQSVSLPRVSVHSLDFKTYVKQFIEPTSAVLSIETSFQESCAIRQAPGEEIK
jgi:hypothetical protein